MIDLNAAIFATLGLGTIFATVGVVIGLALAPEPIITHTSSAELSACVVALDRSADALDELEAWLHEMQGVWIISTDEVPE